MKKPDMEKPLSTVIGYDPGGNKRNIYVRITDDYTSLVWDVCCSNNAYYKGKMIR